MSVTREPLRIPGLAADPVGLEIMWSRLIAITDEMWTHRAADRRLDGHRRGAGLRLRVARRRRKRPGALHALDAGLQPGHAGDDAGAARGASRSATMRPGDVYATQRSLALRRPPRRYRDRSRRSSSGRQRRRVHEHRRPYLVDRRHARRPARPRPLRGGAVHPSGEALRPGGAERDALRRDRGERPPAGDGPDRHRRAGRRQRRSAPAAFSPSSTSTRWTDWPPCADDPPGTGRAAMRRAIGAVPDGVYANEVASRSTARRSDAAGDRDRSPAKRSRSTTPVRHRSSRAAGSTAPSPTPVPTRSTR